MKIWVVAVLFILLFGLTIPFVMAGDEPEEDPPEMKEGKITKAPTPIATITAVKTISPTSVDPTRFLTPAKRLKKGSSVNVEYKESDPLYQFKKLIGIDEPTTVDVTISGKKVATLPIDSPLVGLVVHQECLKYQYGTMNYHNCEVALQ